MKLTFGKHKGKSLKEIPLDYLSWLICFVDNKPVLVEQAKKELENRGKNLEDLYEEKEKLIKVGVLSEDGQRDHRKYQQIKQAELRVLKAYIFDQLNDSGIFKSIEDYDSFNDMDEAEY